MDNSLNLVIHIDFELNNIVDRLDYPVAAVDSTQSVVGDELDLHQPLNIKKV
jgi:hypothetical protein